MDNLKTENNHVPNYYGKTYVFGEDSINSEDHVKGFYDSLQIKRPKSLLPREIALYSHMVEDIQTMVDLNQKFRETNEELQNKLDKTPNNSFLSKKWFVSWMIATLFVSVLSCFAQFALDTDRKSLKFENQKLQQSELLIENKELKEQVESLRHKKACFFF